MRRLGVIKAPFCRLGAALAHRAAKPENCLVSASRIADKLSPRPIARDNKQIPWKSNHEPRVHGRVMSSDGIRCARGKKEDF